ncbi:MAG: hypothetical protein AB7D27_16765 [Desulfomicrobium sp.]
MKTMQDWQDYLSAKYFAGVESKLTTWAENFAHPRDKTVVHIPARSGSERLKNKNILHLGGVPLLAYTILVARQLPVDRVIVSTDSAAYAAIAEQYGAETPFLRPKELSGNDIPAGVARAYLLMYLLSQGYPLSSIIDLYPTSPFRNVATLTSYCEIIKKTGHCSTVVSPNIQGGDIYTHGATCVCEGDLFKRSGIYSFKPLGNFFGSKIDNYEILYKCHKVISNPIEMIDIDTKSDFELAQLVVENNLYDFGVAIC